MNVTDFTSLLQKPGQSISSEQTRELEDVLSEFPFFQAARAVHLKGLKNLNSFKYNNALKVTAAYTTDRDILFDFITSKEFLQNSIADSISGKTAPLVETEIVSAEVVGEAQKNDRMIDESVDSPLPQTLDDADHILDPDLFKSKDPKIDEEIKKAKAEAALEIGRPLAFTKKERYSFSEWLQLTTKSAEQNADDTHKAPTKDDHKLEASVLKEKKFELIDKFIAQRPKIVPNEEQTARVDIEKATKIDAEELMTETLAKVYLEQKKYKKAIQAYRILSLKYPEKSGFFADRIRAVEKIQQENS